MQMSSAKVWHIVDVLEGQLSAPKHPQIKSQLTRGGAAAPKIYKVLHGLGSPHNTTQREGEGYPLSGKNPLSSIF